MRAIIFTFLFSYAFTVAYAALLQWRIKSKAENRNAEKLKSISVGRNGWLARALAGLLLNNGPIPYRLGSLTYMGSAGCWLLSQARAFSFRRSEIRERRSAHRLGWWLAVSGQVRKI